MWKADGWDSDFKLGLVIPHADIGPEAEVQSMLTGHSATVHGARIDFSPMHPGGTIDEKIAHDPVLRFVDPEVIDGTVKSLSSAPLDAIGLAFTSSSFKIGAGREREMLERLMEISHGIRIETTGTAATLAIRQLELEKIAIMAPSWFDDQLCVEGEAYFTDQGIDIISATPSGPPGGPLEIDASSTTESVREVIDSTGAKAVFIAGNGQRAIGAINYLETELDITVLTANQVLLWASLADTALQGRITGYGRLFCSG